MGKSGKDFLKMEIEAFFIRNIECEKCFEPNRRGHEAGWIYVWNSGEWQDVKAEIWESQMHMLVDWSWLLERCAKDSEVKSELSGKECWVWLVSQVLVNPLILEI